MILSRQCLSKHFSGKHLLKPYGKAIYCMYIHGIITKLYVWMCRIRFVQKKQQNKQRTAAFAAAFGAFFTQ